MNDRTRALMIDALDAIEAVREPEGFDPDARYRAECSRAANDYRDLYRQQRDVLDDVCDLLARVRDAVPDDGPVKVRRNCWTCRHNEYDGADSICVSEGYPGPWLNNQRLDERDMPPKTADGCPAWAAKDDA